MKTKIDKTKITVPGGVVVWLDVDGVLVDFHLLMNRVINEKMGTTLADNHIPSGWNWDNEIGAEKFKELFKALPINWPENLQAYKGASDFTHTVKNLGCWLNIITDVPGPSTIYRLKNLKKNKIFYHSIYFTNGSKKSEFAKILYNNYVDSKGNPCKHIFVDDRALNAIDMLDNMPNLNLAVTLDYAFNKEDLDTIRKRFSLKRASITAKNPQEAYSVAFDRIMDLSGSQDPEPEVGISLAEDSEPKVPTE